MPAARQPPLKPGRVYRTRELARWSANPTRLAQRLVRDGVLEKLAPGLFVHPKTSRFGAVPPTTEELLRGFLQGGAYVITGPERWNALGLGTTAALAVTLVYNTKRSGEIALGGRRFLFRRVAFPERPNAEWFAIDLVEHAEMAGASRWDLEAALARAVRSRKLGRQALRGAASDFGTRSTRELVERAIARAPSE
ncbi:MAG: DUF6088 family protein [Polyangiaceae bacterium]